MDRAGKLTSRDLGAWSGRGTLLILFLGVAHFFWMESYALIAFSLHLLEADLSELISWGGREQKRHERKLWPQSQWAPVSPAPIPQPLLPRPPFPSSGLSNPWPPWAGQEYALWGLPGVSGWRWNWFCSVLLCLISTWWILALGCP